MSNNNNEKYEKLISLWMDNMFECKDNIHQFNPLLKLLHENKVMNTDKFKALNNALMGFNSNVGVENEIYDNLVHNVDFKPDANDEINLVKLLANVNSKVIVSKDVLQSVILSWLLTNREYSCSKTLLNDANDLYKKLQKYKQMKYGGTAKDELNNMINYIINIPKHLLKNILYLKYEEIKDLNHDQFKEYLNKEVQNGNLDNTKLAYISINLPLQKVKNLNTLNPTYYSKDLENVNKLVDYVKIKTIINDMKKEVEGVVFSNENNNNNTALINRSLPAQLILFKKGGVQALPHIVSINYHEKLESLYKNLKLIAKKNGFNIDNNDDDKMY